jgi:hypothetical protein
MKTLSLTDDDYALILEALRVYQRTIRNGLIKPNFSEVNRQMKDDYSRLSTIISKINNL